MNNLKNILLAIANAGGKPLIVGGWVRDKVMGGVESKDIDVEVFGLSLESLKNCLTKFGEVNEVGVSFGVLKFKSFDKSLEMDFSLPRRDSKNGMGHKGFVVETNPYMSVEEAASRRDFTINAMSYDLLNDKLIDPFNGKADIENGFLTATSEHFSEDPLRVLRGMQFAGRFNLEVDRHTAVMCSFLYDEYKNLAIERVWTEWEKWALRSVKPSAGLRFLFNVEWSPLFPELHRLDGCLQSPVWHPEGDALIHTMHVCDEAMVIANREKLEDDDKLVLMFAALCHDMGKPVSSQGRYPNITSRGHDKAGVPHAEAFLYRIGAPQWLVLKVKPLVSEHMAYLNCGSVKAARNLAVRLEPANMLDLVYLIEADHNGRPPLRKGLPQKAVEMFNLAKKENVLTGKPKAFISGRHLQELGETPGPVFGYVVKAAYKAQCHNKFSDFDGAMQWLKTNLKSLKHSFEQGV